MLWALVSSRRALSASTRGVRGPGLRARPDPADGGRGSRGSVRRRLPCPDQLRAKGIAVVAGRRGQPAAPCPTAWIAAWACSACSSLGVGGLEVEHHLLDRAGERIGRLGLVVEVDDEPVVAADVHAGVGGERDRAPCAACRPRRSARRPPTASRAAGAGLGLVGLEQHLHGDVAGRDRLGRHLLVGLHAEEGVGVVEQAARSPTHSANPPMKSALATITPSAPPSGTCEVRPRWRRSGRGCAEPCRAECSGRRRRT